MPTSHVFLSVVVFSVCAHFLIVSVQDLRLAPSFSFCVLVVSSILSVFNLSVDSVLCQRSSLDGVFLILVRFSYCFPSIILSLSDMGSASDSHPLSCKPSLS